MGNVINISRTQTDFIPSLSQNFQTLVNSNIIPRGLILAFELGQKITYCYAPIFPMTDFHCFYPNKRIKQNQYKRNFLGKPSSLKPLKFRVTRSTKIF